MHGDVWYTVSCRDNGGRTQENTCCSFLTATRGGLRTAAHGFQNTWNVIISRHFRRHVSAVKTFGGYRVCISKQVSLRRHSAGRRTTMRLVGSGPRHKTSRIAKRKHGNREDTTCTKAVSAYGSRDGWFRTGSRRRFVWIVCLLFPVGLEMAKRHKYNTRISHTRPTTRSLARPSHYRWSTNTTINPIIVAGKIGIEKKKETLHTFKIHKIPFALEYEKKKITLVWVFFFFYCSSNTDPPSFVITAHKT